MKSAGLTRLLSDNGCSVTDSYQRIDNRRRNSRQERQSNEDSRTFSALADIRENPNGHQNVAEDAHQDQQPQQTTNVATNPLCLWTTPPQWRHRHSCALRAER